MRWPITSPAITATAMPMVIAGDFNVAPLPADVWDHLQLSRIVTHTPIEIAALERMKRSLQFIDALREVVPADDPVFTWWSYRAADWQAANKGRRLDHIWVTQPLKARIAGVEVLVDIRHWTPPSDHVPVIVVVEAAHRATRLRLASQQNVQKRRAPP